MSRSEQRSRYKARNPEKVKAWAAAYRKRHSERLAATRRAYREANRKELQVKENERRRVKREEARKNWLILPGTEEFTPEIQRDRAIRVTTLRPRFQECTSVEEVIGNIMLDRTGVMVGRNIDQAVAEWAAVYLRRPMQEELATKGTAGFRLGFATYQIEYSPGSFARITRAQDGERRRRVTWWDIGWMLSGETQNIAWAAQIRDQELAWMGTRLRSWHSPAAVASVWMRHHGVKEHLTPVPSEVQDAAQRAYFGGDIRCFRVGVFDEPVQKFDLNSAYAWALAQMPSFSRGYWTQSPALQFDNPWSMFRVEWDLGDKETDPCYPVTPFPWRGENGLVCYPRAGKGWYWSPLIHAALRAWGSERIRVYDRGFTWYPDDGYLPPFSWLADIYRYRQRVGEPLADILKVAMSSVYGKLVQQGDRWPNPYEHIAAAGLCTSLVRAKMLQAAVGCSHGVISALTDCLWIKTKFIDLCRNRSGLGNWRHTPLDGFANFSPNFYLEKGQRKSWWDHHAAGCHSSVVNFEGPMHGGRPVSASGSRKVLWTPALCHAQGRWEMLGKVEEQPVELSLWPRGGFSDMDDKGQAPIWNNYNPCQDQEYRNTISAPYRKLDK